MILAVFMKDGWTALHDAAAHGHVECAQALIEAGADINLQAQVSIDQ